MPKRRQMARGCEPVLPLKMATRSASIAMIASSPRPEAKTASCEAGRRLQISERTGRAISLFQSLCSAAKNPKSSPQSDSKGSVVKVNITDTGAAPAHFPRHCVSWATSSLRRIGQHCVPSHGGNLPRLGARRKWRAPFCEAPRARCCTTCATFF